MHCLAVLLFLVASDSTGTITGRVLVGADRVPVRGANVIVVGTRRGTQTDDDGSFRIERVPPGIQTIRVLSLGHAAKSESLEVHAGLDPVAREFVLESRPVPEPIRIGNRSLVSMRDLQATIRPAVRFHVGDKASFEVRIRNRGRDTAHLVTSVDDSDAWASPKVTIDIEGPPGGWVVPRTLRCGNTNGVSFDDVFEIGPGDSFDPYRNGWRGPSLELGTFAKPGRYKATFRYDTTNTDAQSWISGPCVDCTVSESFRAMLEEIPAVALTATTTFEVTP